MHMNITAGPVDWKWRRFREECRGGVVFDTTYVTVGIFHVFLSRKIR